MKPRCNVACCFFPVPMLHVSLRRQDVRSGSFLALVAKRSLCAHPTCGASEASVRSGSFLALDCKAFFMRGSKALRFGIRLFSASTAFLLWLCCSTLRTTPHALMPCLLLQ